MSFVEFLNQIEGTEQEQQLYEEIEKIKGQVGENLDQTMKIPVVGKLFGAILALAEIGSIAEFKESEHYAAVHGWDCKIDLEKGSFNLYPGPEMRKQLFKVLIIVGVAIFLIIRWIKKRRNR